MRFRDFEAHAREVFEEIPDVYREGIDGLTIRREAPRHPDLEGIYTLGECLTEEHLSDFGSSDTTRSVIALYWGSFRALARDNPDFDWDDEIWETLTHELRHHLESLAGDDALEGVDYAADESFKRFDDEDFDPWYYQHGVEEAPGLFRVEKAWYLEQTRTDATFASASWIHFRFRGTEYRFARPGDLGDVHFVLVDGLDLGDDVLEVVLVRHRGWLSAVLGWFRGAERIVLESEAVVEPVESSG